MDVDGSRLGGRGDTDAGGEQLCPAPAAAGPEHELSRIDTAGECEQGVRDIGTHHLVIGAAEVFHQDSLPSQMCGIATAEAVIPHYVYGEQVGPLGAGGDAGGAADQRLALWPAGDRDHYSLPGLPV